MTTEPVVPADSAIPEHIEHRIESRDGRILAAAEWGDPNGVALFALHGTPGSRVAFWQDPTIYARHGLRRITLDRPGMASRPGCPAESSPTSSPTSSPLPIGLASNHSP